MKKKIIAIGLILSLMTTPILSGCSNGSTSQTSSTPTEATTDAPVEEELNIVYFEERGNIPKPDSLNANVVYDRVDYDGYYYDLNLGDFETNQSFYMLYCQALIASGYMLYDTDDELFDEYDMQWEYNLYYSTKSVAKVRFVSNIDDDQYQMCIRFFKD